MYRRTLEKGHRMEGDRAFGEEWVVWLDINGETFDKECRNQAWEARFWANLCSLESQTKAYRPLFQAERDRRCSQQGSATVGFLSRGLTADILSLPIVLRLYKSSPLKSAKPVEREKLEGKCCKFRTLFLKLVWLNFYDPKIEASVHNSKWPQLQETPSYFTQQRGLTFKYYVSQVLGVHFKQSGSFSSKNT